jgi:CRISPR type III-A-associated RAMP protein Csm3
MPEELRLRGRLFLDAEIHAVTGLHIGGAGGKVAIGGVDSPVIRDPITDEPILPGSSLKGKMRSLLERWGGYEPNHPIGQARIHVCQSPDRYSNCPVCHIFGVPGELPFAYPTRLVVRDAFLTDGSREALRRADTDLPFTEVKWEAAIDRITSAAVPRQIERVPAGAVFRARRFGAPAPPTKPGPSWSITSTSPGTWTGSFTWWKRWGWWRTITWAATDPGAAARWPSAACGWATRSPPYPPSTRRPSPGSAGIRSRTWRSSAERCPRCWIRSDRTSPEADGRREDLRWPWRSGR